MKNKLIITGYLLIFCCEVVIAQKPNEAMCNESDTIFHHIINIELPCKFKKKKTVYDEGVFIDYYYLDGAILTLFKGALHKTPLYSNDSENQIQSVDTINGKISYRGSVNKKRWREDIIADLHIYYNNVPIEKEKLFNKVLDNASILKEDNP